MCGTKGDITNRWHHCLGEVQERILEIGGTTVWVRYKGGCQIGGTTVWVRYKRGYYCLAPLFGSGTSEDVR